MMALKFISEKTNSFFKWFSGNIKEIICSTLVLLFWFAYKNRLIFLFDKYILDVFNLEISTITNALFIVFCLFLLGILYGSYKNKYVLSYKHMLLIVLYLFFYLNIRLTENYILLPSNWVFGYIDIVNIIVFGGLIICIWNRYKPKNKASDELHKNDRGVSYIPDIPIKKTEDDILDYAKDAESLALRLDNISVYEPCSIGIISPWGTGKTSYINLVEQSVDASKYIIIKFNPRHSKNHQTIQDDFFLLLLSKIHRYNSEFSRLFDNYIDAISALDNKLNTISSFWKLTQSFDKEDIKDRINNALMLLPKRIVVFIDDFDRLLDDWKTCLNRPLKNF